MLGLKRGTVEIVEYQEEWEIDASKTIDVLWEILKDIVVDIQHVGSTSIKQIHAKPIIDIAVGLENLDDIKPYLAILEDKGIIFRGNDHPNQLLLVIGNFDLDTRSHHIHVVIHNSDEWNNYLNFRDYLNEKNDKAYEYDTLKLTLAKQYPQDRIKYSNGKKELIDQLLKEAREWRNNK